MKFHVTYDRCTPESAEHADYSESGFAYPHGRCELESHVFGEAAGKVKEANALSLREALQVFDVRDRGIEDTGTSFYESGWYVISYRTGEEERLALHCPDNITPSSLARVRRLLGLK